jgi:uncharacterized protein YkwD
MRKQILALATLVVLTGCNHNQPQPHYTPIDWNNPADPPPNKQQPVTPAPTPAAPQENSVNQQLLSLHNHERELKGRPGLEIDQKLNQYAQEHANWMAQHNNLQHSDINNIFKLDIPVMTAGENIAWNQQDAAEVVNAWMHSTGHRDNILNRKFTKVGFGVAYNAKGEPYWCTCFGG